MPSSRSNTKQHRWMQMSYTPVEIVGKDDNGEPSAIPISDPITGISCFDCSLPLNSATVAVPCEGVENKAM